MCTFSHVRIFFMTWQMVCRVAKTAVPTNQAQATRTAASGVWSMCTRERLNVNEAMMFKHIGE